MDFLTQLEDNTFNLILGIYLQKNLVNNIFSRVLCSVNFGSIVSSILIPIQKVFDK